MFELFLKCSYFGPKIEARCSYKIVRIKKACNQVNTEGKQESLGNGLDTFGESMVIMIL